jgi:hypothetical protein
MGETIKAITITATTALVIFSILVGTYYGVMTSEEKVNGPEKFANSSLIAALTLTGILMIGLYVSAQTLLETPEQMTLLLLGQGLYMVISGIILVFVLMNIKFG